MKIKDDYIGKAMQETICDMADLKRNTPPEYDELELTLEFLLAEIVKLKARNMQVDAEGGRRKKK